MNLETENIPTDDFFKYISGTREFLGISDIKKSNIFIPPNRLNSAAAFLSSGIFADPKQMSHDYTLQSVADWQCNIEYYCKDVWLTNDLIVNKRFNNLMGAHWNPDINKFDIHPGGSRIYIQDFFGEDTTEFVTFNTGGIDVEWKKIYNSTEELQNDFPSAVLAICKEYNTLIPHVHIGTDSIRPAVIRLHKKIKDFFETTKIIANFDLSKVSYSPAIIKTHKKTVTVTIDKIDAVHIMKAFCLLPNFENFNGSGVTIKTT